MRTPETPALPPAAVLIRRARLASNLTPEQAAPRTGMIKASRWRQVEKGQVPRDGRADNLWAHMAHVVGVTPEQFDEIGLTEAAGILREIIRKRAGESPGALIRQAREGHHWSPEYAAELLAKNGPAGIAVTAGQWRQMEAGGPASVALLAHAAATVGVPADHLDGAGYGDVADALRQITAAQPPLAPDDDPRLTEIRKLWSALAEAQRQMVYTVVRAAVGPQPGELRYGTAGRQSFTPSTDT